MFEPVKGKARWRLCYDIITELQPGDVVTYAEVEELCSCNRNAAQAAMIKADAELGKIGLNRVRTRPNIGWIVLAPDETIDLISHQREKSERADDRTAGRINAAQRRREDLSPESRATLDHEQRVAARKIEINGRRRRESRTLAARLAELESQQPKKLRGA